MADRLKDKVVLIVGAGSIGPGWGNGKATAVLFAREGAAVMCADVNLDAAEETARIIRDAGGTAQAHAANVAIHADIEAMVAATVARFGRIDILDYNVGIAEVGGVADLAEADWDKVFDINLKGCFLTLKHVLPVMEGQGSGSVVAISSIASIRHTGVPFSSYYATKAALNQLIKSTAIDYASKGIRLNLVLPGLMKTPMVEKSAGIAGTYAKGDVSEMWKIRDAQCPMGHMGDAWDVAQAALFLASDESKYITGLELLVDGGITLKYS